jgi:hypothetical protein
MNLPALNCFKRVFPTVGLVALTAWITTGAEQSQAQSNRSSTNLADDIHLYGQVAQPDQVSKGYVVFQNIEGEVVGAVYYPRSEFSCFQGNLDGRTLDVQPIAANSEDADRSTAELLDFYKLPVSENDRRILSQCKREVKAASNPF